MHLRYFRQLFLTNMLRANKFLVMLSGSMVCCLDLYFSEREVFYFEQNFYICAYLFYLCFSLNPICLFCFVI